MKVALQTVASSLGGLVLFGLLVFWPAGTFDYWQGWAFIAVFAAATTIPSLYLAATNPEALKRRMQAGPVAETRPLQKLIISFAFLSLGATHLFLDGMTAGRGYIALAILVLGQRKPFGFRSQAFALSSACDIDRFETPATRHNRSTPTPTPS